MKRILGLPILVAASLLAGCRPSPDRSPDLMEVLGGRAVQWPTVLSKDAWARSRTRPAVVPNDSASFVGISKAYGPGLRYDLYYVAIAGPSDAVGETLCHATAKLTDIRAVPGFGLGERVIVTETWDPDTCGWDLDGERYDVVYALDGDGKTLHTWAPSAERPADVQPIPAWQPPDGASLILCSEPSIALTGTLEEGHPAEVCDPVSLFGRAGFSRTNVPFWNEE